MTTSSPSSQPLRVTTGETKIKTAGIQTKKSKDAENNLSYNDDDEDKYVFTLTDHRVFVSETRQKKSQY